VQKGATRGTSIAAFILVLLGVLLLLSNYLVISGFNLGSLWPLLLVVAGITILVQGDLTNPASSRSFGITRGTVESATAEISAGEIDVHLHASPREGRLVAGQYAVNSRPALDVQGNHAHLRMDRAATPWLSFSDWELGIARDLPWRVLISTHLGAVEADLHDLVIDEAVIATGIGDIRLTVPKESFAPLLLRSATGDIHVYTPPGMRASVRLVRSPLTGLHVDENRYETDDTGVFHARAAESVFQAVEIHISTTFGDIYLA
jgi:hypothetical protein